MLRGRQPDQAVQGRCRLQVLSLPRAEQESQAPSRIARQERRAVAEGRRAVRQQPGERTPQAWVVEGDQRAASEHAGVSTPVAWKEIEAGVDRREFTIETVPARLEKVGDLWAPLRKAKGVDLTKVTRYASRST